MKREYTPHTRAEHYPQNTCSHTKAVSIFHFVPLELTSTRKHSLHTAYQSSECHSQHLLSAVAVSTLHCCPTRTEGAPYHQLISTRKHSLCTTHTHTHTPTPTPTPKPTHPHPPPPPPPHTHTHTHSPTLGMALSLRLPHIPPCPQVECACMESVEIGRERERRKGRVEM